MKYLFTYWLIVMLLPLCITATNLEPWMPKASVEKKKVKQEPAQELVMNPIFIFK